MQLMGSVKVEGTNTKQGCFGHGRISRNGNDCRVELTSEFGAAEMQVRALEAFNRCDWLCSVGFSSEVAKGCCCVDLTGAQAPVGGCSLMRIIVV
jgi:hypothetical protein